MVVGAMDDLCRADSRQVAVSLVGKDDGVGPRPLDTGGNGRSPAVGSLYHVDVEVAVEEDGTSHGSNAYRALLHAELVHRLGNETMDGAVMTSGTEVGLDILQTDRSLEYLLHNENLGTRNGDL